MSGECTDGLLDSPCDCLDCACLPLHVYPPRCPKCGRWVKWGAIESEDYLDPGAYYGVSSHEWTNCPQCGRVEGARWF